MGESKHLPGPWYVRHAVLSGRRGRAEIRTTNGGIGELVAVVVRGEQGAATADANADVLAAAPQMLEALRESLRVLEDDSDATPRATAREMARAAIKAATGGET